LPLLPSSQLKVAIFSALIGAKSIRKRQTFSIAIQICKYLPILAKLISSIIVLSLFSEYLDIYNPFIFIRRMPCFSFHPHVCKKRARDWSSTP
jgi:hypothetical protein